MHKGATSINLTTSPSFYLPNVPTSLQRSSSVAMTKNTTQQLQVEAAQKRKTNKVKISRQRETKDKLQYTNDDT